MLDTHRHDGAHAFGYLCSAEYVTADHGLDDLYPPTTNVLGALRLLRLFRHSLLALRHGELGVSAFECCSFFFAQVVQAPFAIMASSSWLPYVPAPVDYGHGNARVAVVGCDVSPTPPSTGHVISLPLSQVDEWDERVASVAVEPRVQVAAVGGPLPPKRRRLSSKTPAALAVQYPPPDANQMIPSPQPARLVRSADNDGDGDDDAELSFPAEEEWTCKSDQKKYNWLYERIRSHFIKSNIGDDLEEPPEITGRERYKLRKSLFGKLSLARKDKASRDWCEAIKPPSYISERAKFIFIGGVKGFKLRSQQKQALLTYSGPWVLRDNAGDHADLSGRTVDDVVALVRSSDTWNTTWDVFTRFCEELKKKYNAAEYCACMELCTSTLQDQGLGRIHFHVFFRSDRLLSDLITEELLFQKVRPCNSNNITGVSNRSRNNWAGYFYVVVEKIGCIFSVGARRPFRDFTVRSEWIMNLVQCKKLTVDHAKILLARVINGAPRHLKDLETCAQLEEEFHVQAVLQEAERALALTRRSWRELPEIVGWQREAVRASWFSL